MKLTKRHAEAVSDAIREIDDETLNDQVAEFIENVKGNADAVQSNLEDFQFGEFDVVFSALNYNYSWKLYAARRIRAENEDVLTEEATTRSTMCSAVRSSNEISGYEHTALSQEKTELLPRLPRPGPFRAPCEVRIRIEEGTRTPALHRSKLFTGVREVLDDTPVSTELADNRL